MGPLGGGAADDDLWMPMKSIYFLSFNMISFVPYAFGFLKSYAQQDAQIASAYHWHPPFTTPRTGRYGGVTDRGA
jgi:hypothetical protein